MKARRISRYFCFPILSYFPLLNKPSGVFLC